jgi:2-keto-3-deoxy-L-rhamnonate aldolase RhmA/quercetin dioxygenase-like cupin family protein
MKREALEHLRQSLAADRAVHGLWITLESPSITEMAVALGLDWVVIDAEHGHLDWDELVAHVRATVRSKTVCLIRLAALDQGLIKRALDIGADGVVIPWMESAEQVRAALHAARFPLTGRRGIGAERATAWGRCIAEHVAESSAALVVPIIESVAGGENAAAMAAVDGVELLFVGPADWSATAGCAGQWAGPEVAAQIAGARDAVRAAGKHVGVLATSDDDLRRRRHEGFRMLGLGIDGALLLRAIDGMLPATGELRSLSTTLTPRTVGGAAAPLREVPAQLRCERLPRAIAADQAPRIDLDQGAVVSSLVGRACASRDLTAAIVRFAPGGTLVRHQHPEPETVVVVAGEIVTEVAGLRRRFRAGECVTIPAGVPHQTGNASEDVEAVIHVAMPSDVIARTLASPAPNVRDASDAGEQPVARESGLGHALMVEHSGPSRPAGRVRCRSWRLAAGGSLPARVQAVDAAVVVLEGRLRLRTEREVVTVERFGAVHLPRGNAYEVTALGATLLVETCADLEPLDAHIDPAALKPLEAAVMTARAG